MFFGGGFIFTFVVLVTVVKASIYGTKFCSDFWKQKKKIIHRLMLAEVLVFRQKVDKFQCFSVEMKWVFWGGFSLNSVKDVTRACVVEAKLADI